MESSSGITPQSESDQKDTIYLPFVATTCRAARMPSLGLEQYRLRGRTDEGSCREVLLELWIGPESKPHIVVSVELETGRWTLSAEPGHYMQQQTLDIPPAPEATKRDLE